MYVFPVCTNFFDIIKTYHHNNVIYMTCEYNKYFTMQAGIIRVKDSLQLLIALEPEAASVFCRSLKLNHFIGISREDGKPTFKTGTKYLVIDAGG